MLNNCGVSTFASENENRKLNTDYSKFSATTIADAAEKFFQTALNAKSDEERTENLEKAAAQYYILSNMNKSDSYPCIQLGRIYDIQGNDKYAKAYFSQAIGINSKDINANFYLAEYYYKRKQYQKALEYYQKSLMYGKLPETDIYEKIGYIYQKFADVKRANFYYNAALELDSNNKELRKKVNQSSVNDYEKSGYYQRRLQK